MEGNANPPSSRLLAALEASRGYGFLGPGPLDVPLAHGMAFIEVGRAASRVSGFDPDSAHWLDLGSGGGLPGLVGIDQLPDSSWVLLDAQAKRIRFLERVVDEWAVGDRVRCVLGRAEELYREGRTGTVDIVVARGFGQPSVTAECATGLLVVGGVLVVSEPPDSDGARWQGIDSAELGLTFSGVVREGGFGFAVIEKRGQQRREFPRVGAMLTKQLLF